MMFFPSAREAGELSDEYLAQVGRVNELLRHVGRAISHTSMHSCAREVTLRVHDVAPRYSWEAGYIVSTLEQMEFVCEWSEDDTHLCVRWPKIEPVVPGYTVCCVAWPAVVVAGAGVEWWSGGVVVWVLAVLGLLMAVGWLAAQVIPAMFMLRVLGDVDEETADDGEDGDDDGTKASAAPCGDATAAKAAAPWNEIDFQMVLTRAVLEAERAFKEGRRARANLEELVEAWRMPAAMVHDFVQWVLGRECDTHRGRRLVVLVHEFGMVWIEFRPVPVRAGEWGYDWDRGAWGVAGEEGRRGDGETRRAEVSPPLTE
jgi:hypothetical protein